MERDLNALRDSAKSLYDAADYSGALELYKTLEQAQVKESALFHNMGNTYVRLGELGEARLYYERALVFDPANADAIHNLDWLKMRLTDQMVDPKQELIDWLSIALRSVMETQHWGILSWALALVVIGLLLWRKFRNPKLSWRLPLTGTVLALLLLLASWLSKPKSFIAVNVEASSYGYSEPYGRGKRIVLLSEGTAGRLVRESDGWFYVELGDGRLAWFNAEEWERVLHYKAN